MWKNNRRAVSVIYSVLLLLFVLVLTGCPDAFNLQDDVERDLDRPLPGVAELSEPQLDDPYDTQPIWTWEGDPIEGTQIFRFRLNGGEWRIPNPPNSTSYSVADSEDEAGDPRHLYPGTYLFEVQERNRAGNWSPSAEISNIIRVREPVFMNTPPMYSNTLNPSFSWEQWRTGEPPVTQYGASNSFSWRLDRRADGEWIPINSASATDRSEISYMVEESLVEGLYRFGVSEKNRGGDRSAYTHAHFTVDTTPPGPPSVFGPATVSNSDTSATAFTLTPAAGDTFARLHWQLFRENGEAVAEFSGTTSATNFLVNLSTESGGPGLGSYYLEVFQEDLAGNVGLVPAVLPVRVEPIPILATVLMVNQTIAVRLEWTEFGFPVAGYEYQMSNTETFTTGVTTYTEESPLITVVELDGLPPGQTLYFRVRTLDDQSTPGGWSNVETVRTTEDFGIAHNTSNASGWFGGDARVDMQRNIGVGFGITMPASTVINEVGYAFTGVSSDSNEVLPETLTMIVTVRDSSGVSLSVHNRVFTPPELSQEFFFIVSGIDLLAPAGETFIFTFYMVDAHLQPYPRASALGDSGSIDPFAFRFTGTGNAGNEFDLNAWTSWSTHSWRPLYSLNGTATR